MTFAVCGITLSCTFLCRHYITTTWNFVLSCFKKGVNTKKRLNFFFFWTYNPGQKSLGQYCLIHVFLSFLGSLLNQCIFFEFSCSSSSLHPLQSWNSEKNSRYKRPTLFVGWGEGLDLCESENAPEMQKCPKTFVHDCRNGLLEFESRKKRPIFPGQIERDGIRTKRFEAVRIQYLCDVFAAVASVNSRAP